MINTSLHTSDFDFELPPELIASHPLEKRDASRMLVVIPSQGAYTKFHAKGGVLQRGGVERRCETWDDSKFPSIGGVPQRGGVVRDCVNYKTLPFNANLKDRAKALRKAGSLPEALLWQEIKNRQLNGLDFDRQKIIGNYIVDFFCPSNFVVIEIDDTATHNMKEVYDAARDKYLKSLNLTVIHISASDVLKDPHSVYDWLSNHPGLRPPLQRRGTETPDIQCDVADSADTKFYAKGGVPQRGGVVRDCVRLADKHIRDFLDYLRPGDVVVFNNSRVIPARFMADGKHEITLHTCMSDDNKVWWGLCRKFTKLHIGDILTLDDGTQIKIISKNAESGLKIEFLCDDVFAVLDKVGKMPLPPYMKREEEDTDRERYQTVYSQPLGSLAAPTAGLHFTNELMDEIEKRGAKIVKVTLHVGAGTWMPVKTEDLTQHKMHREWCRVTPAQADIINRAKRVIAVGTTSMRTLESAARRSAPGNRVAPFCDTTNIFITPGYNFRAVDVLLTNFHLPKSTLFMLVSAFSGLEEMKTAYKHAIDEKYRFFSYGDCCLLFKKDAQ